MLNTMEFYTLGFFKIKRGNETITKDIQKLSKSWKLLQYLVLNSNCEVSREELITALQLNNNDDPEGALSALIYKLRKTLNNNSSVEYIITLSSAYTFNNKIEYWFDAEEFAKLCEITDKHIDKSLSEAIITFDQALDLYKGDFLQEAKTDEWIWSARNHYRNLLIDTMIRMDYFLRDQGDFEKSLEFYDRLNEFVFFDELIIKGQIQTMIEAGRYGQAKKKYNEIIKLYEDNSLMVPPELEDIAEKLTFKKKDTLLGVLDNVKNKRSLAYLTSPDNFINLYNLEKRRSERTGIPRMVVHIKIIVEENFKNIEELEDKMLNLLIKHLRGGDIVCRWDECHFILLLLDIEPKDVQVVIDRIENTFIAKYGLPETVMLEERSFIL